MVSIRWWLKRSNFSFASLQEFESLQLLNDMLDNPSDFWSDLKRYTTSIGSTVTYGHRSPILNAPKVDRLFQVPIPSLARPFACNELTCLTNDAYTQWLDRFSLLQERSQLADWYPVLKPLFLRLPAWASGFLKEATALRDMELKMWDELISDALRIMQEGRMHPSECLENTLPVAGC